MAGIYSQGGTASHRYAGWLETVEAKNFQFGGKVFNGSPSAIYVGINLVWANWLTKAAKQAIMDAFLDDGMAVINATNAYLNQLAASDIDKATALADYINDYPLSAALYGGLYVQDGLVFQMDCAYMCSGSMWESFIGNNNFEGKGNIQIVDGAPYFNNTGWYEGAEMSHPFATSTIEFVMACDEERPTTNLGTGFCENSANNTTTRVQTSLLDSNRGPAFNFATTMRYYPTPYGPLSTFACANGNVYRNKVKLTNSGTTGTTINHGAGTFIGKRYKTDATSLRATKIYGIRIYNRLLTEAEILANQDIDLKRFTPSTP